MRIIIAGGSGLIGHALVVALRADGHDVQRLVRRQARAADEVSWDPARHTLDPARLEVADAIVNLAGENLSAGRWTAARRERILRSRVDATGTLVEAVTRIAHRPTVLVSASAVGFYGGRGDETLSERSGIGRGFLPEVCLAWEADAQRAIALGLRVVCLRLGVVLTGEGGALGKMLPLFRLGLGGRLGNGRQWMSWITRDDVIGVVAEALADRRFTGAINTVAPEPVTNAAFTKALGTVLHRPTLVPAPAWALRLAFGEMADAALLASTRAVPDRLEALGYRFKHPHLAEALAAVLRDRR